MDNRIFFPLLGLGLLAWFGWIGYDAWVTSSTPPPQLRGDLLGRPDGGAAQVRYLYQFPEAVLSHDLDQVGIERLRPSDQAKEGGKVHGLTIADYDLGSRYVFQVRKRWFREGYLAWLEDLQVEFEYKDLKVYLDRAYPEGSCEYNETKWHEEQHVRIHKETYERYKALLEEAVTSATGIPLRAAPVTVATREEGKKVVGEKVAAVLDPLFQAFDEELKKEQGTIDTEASYQALSAHCPGW